MRNGIESPFDGFSPFGRRRRGIKVPYLLRARASQWDGTQLVGDGLTFVQADPTARPTLSSGALLLDGTNDKITATVSFDLAGKTIYYVCKPTAINAQQDSIITMQGPGSAYVQLEARTSGEFEGRHRSANIGAGLTSVDPTTPGNVLPDRMNTLFVGVVRYTNEVTVLNGHDAAARTSLTAGAKPMTSITIGCSRLTDFFGGEFHEFGLIDSTEDAVINAAMERIAAQYGIDVPLFTPFLDQQVRGLGDSIEVGIASTSNANGFNEVLCRKLIADKNESGLADVQMSPFGFTVPADNTKIAACFSRRAQDAALFTGMSLIMVHYGVNDFRRDVPIGTISDATESTFYGAMNVGFDYLQLNAPTIPVIVTLPFYMEDEDIPNAEGHVLQDYRDAIAAVCLARGITNADMSLTGVNAGNVGSFTSDGLHPNDAGHALGYDVMLPVVKRGVGVPSAFDAYARFAPGVAGDIFIADAEYLYTDRAGTTLVSAPGDPVRAIRGSVNGVLAAVADDAKYGVYAVAGDKDYIEWRSGYEGFIIPKATLSYVDVLGWWADDHGFFWGGHSIGVPSDFYNTFATDYGVGWHYVASIESGTDVFAVEYVFGLGETGIDVYYGHTVNDPVYTSPGTHTISISRTGNNYYFNALKPLITEDVVIDGLPPLNGDDYVSRGGDAGYPTTDLHIFRGGFNAGNGAKFRSVILLGAGQSEPIRAQFLNWLDTA